jgi:hypothetical protein
MCFEKPVKQFTPDRLSHAGGQAAAWHLCHRDEFLKK